jgi:outer membrane protein OmpA-like peptidoglycan-associated protein
MCPEQQRLANEMLATAFTDESIENGIITERTIFPYHFVTNTGYLNELGERDLRVLARHFEKYPPTAGTLVVKDIVENFKVLFDFDESEIRIDYEPVLNEAIGMLNEYSDVHLLVSGHTDVKGSEEYNLRLGNRRAGAVRQYLMDKGIDQGRIRLLSRGEFDAVVPLSTITDMQQDRNAQFVVAKVITEVEDSAIQLSVRRENASRELYLARKNSVVDFLTSHGIDKDMISLGDLAAGGEGMASDRVLTIIGAASGQQAAATASGQASGSATSAQRMRSTSARNSEE